MLASATMGPTGEAIVPQLAGREAAAFVGSITLVNDSIIARFLAVMMVPVPEKGSYGPLSSL